MKINFNIERGVAPFTGAWIEMYRLAKVAMPGQSLPSRERGLKSIQSLQSYYLNQSLPSRERGLKFGQ